VFRCDFRESLTSKGAWHMDFLNPYAPRAPHEPRSVRKR
jgi:hypothetical protein